MGLLQRDSEGNIIDIGDMKKKYEVLQACVGARLTLRLTPVFDPKCRQ